MLLSIPVPFPGSADRHNEAAWKRPPDEASRDSQRLPGSERPRRVRLVGIPRPHRQVQHTLLAHHLRHFELVRQSCDDEDHDVLPPVERVVPLAWLRAGRVAGMHRQVWVRIQRGLVPDDNGERQVLSARKSDRASTMPCDRPRRRWLSRRVAGDTCDNDSGNEGCESHVYFDAVKEVSVRRWLSANLESQVHRLRTARSGPLLSIIGPL
jgi:hypothetical protein